MKAMAPLGLPSCRIPSHHSQWRKGNRQIVQADRHREAERREIGMSKAAVKSDLLAHQDLSVGTGGGEGERREGGGYFGEK